MTQDEILETARQTGVLAGYEGEPSLFVIFAKALMDVEREACALIALEKETIRKDTEKAHYRLSDLPFDAKQFGFDGGAIFEGRRIAARIRARGEQHE
jgi:hypothetical protein